MVIIMDRILLRKSTKRKCGVYVSPLLFQVCKKEKKRRVPMMCETCDVACIIIVMVSPRTTFNGNITPTATTTSPFLIAGAVTIADRWIGAQREKICTLKSTLPHCGGRGKWRRKCLPKMRPPSHAFFLSFPVVISRV